LTDIADKSNLDTKDFKKFIYSQKAKDLLIDNTEDLIKRGGFGSPTFFYNDHMFFGNDRLSLFEESLMMGLLDK
jgi:2-hydroxychromene-2-carboxylate isomerase